MPDLSEYTPRIVEYLLDHHQDDRVHLFQVEWHADLDIALDWLLVSDPDLYLVARCWLDGQSEAEMARFFNCSTDLVAEVRVRLCHTLATWLNEG